MSTPGRWSRSAGPGALLALWGAALLSPVFGASVSLAPLKDNTLYEDPMGSLSNGQGEYLFSGRTSVLADGLVRRAVLAFDVALAIPAGSTITSAALTLNVSQSAPGAGPRPGSLHRLLADWGEGASNAGAPGGTGIHAEAGDATWLHRFYDSDLWSSPGGDHDAASSASIAVGVSGLHTWTSAQMAEDVQRWLDDPAASFGWVLIGDESEMQTAKRYDSRENALVANRPRLDVTYDPPIPLDSGSVPDGNGVPGLPLRIDRSGPELVLDWDASCLATDTDYEVYEGVLRSFSSHQPVGGCSTGGATSATITPAPGSTYYLVVPTNGAAEGSYGVDSTGAQRPASSSSCRVQSLGPCSGPTSRSATKRVP